MSRVVLLGFVAAGMLTGLAAPCKAQAPVSLIRKLPENSAFATATRQKVMQTMMVAGMKQDTSSEQTAVVRTRIGKRAADGSISVNTDFKQLQMQLKIPTLGDVTFDSVNPDKATDSPLTPLLKAISSMAWTSTYDKNNVVTAVAGHDKALESLDAALRDGVKKRYEPDYLRATANDSLDRIPSKPTKPGESWVQTTTTRLDSAQSLTFTKKYTYRGVVESDGKTVDRIDVVTTAVKLEIEGGPGVPIKLIKSDLKIGKSNGTLLFDRQLGRVISETETNQIKGPITLGVGEQEFPAEIDLTIETEAIERPSLLN